MAISKSTKSILSELLDSHSGHSGNGLDDLQNRMDHCISSMINLLDSFDDLDIDEDDKNSLVKWTLLSIKNRDSAKHKKFISHLKRKHQ